jgi:hypothetical protein
MTSSEEASSNSPPPWTEHASLTFIREGQKAFDALGVCPALAGGVLLRGSSDKDLDIQLIPRKDTIVTLDQDFIDKLGSLLGLTFQRSRQWSAGVMLLKFTRIGTGQEIDFFVATPRVALEAPQRPPPMESLHGVRPYVDPKTNRPTRGQPMT